MNSIRKKLADLLPSVSTTDDYLYFRLCHQCLHLNESQSEIVQCERCRTYLTVEPFLDRLPPEVREQWASSRRAELLDDDDEDVELSSESDDRKRAPGLNGLAVLW